jgi:xanthine dehydrogenase accessory factor
MARLREAGIGDAELARLSSPIGLDLGARTPEETAVSIAAEIIAGRWGGGGERLTTTAGRIHHD